MYVYIIYANCIPDAFSAFVDRYKVFLVRVSRYFESLVILGLQIVLTGVGLHRYQFKINGFDLLLLIGDV